MTIREPAKRHPDANGFSLIEVLIGIAILAVIAVAVSGISISFLMQTGENARDRQAEATTAQWASVTFARDVQGAAALASECAPGAGTRLVTFKPSGTGHVIEYRVTESGMTFGLQRVSCGTNDSPLKVVDDLGFKPTVTCDRSACVDGTKPRIVTLHIARSSKFDFTLDGVRRTTDGNLDPALPPHGIPSLLSLGGQKPLTITGAGKLTVNGDAYVNNLGQSGVTLSNSGTLSVTGDLIVQRSSNGQPVLVASGNPHLQVGGNGPTSSEMNLCGWCDIKITGDGPGTASTSFPDPLRFLPKPDTSGLTQRSSCAPQGEILLCQPGIYPTAFPPGGGGDSKFKLEPGIYVLRGGFLLQNARTVQSNGGVLLYLESGGVKVQGAAKLTLSAQPSGPYAGVLFFQPSSNTSQFSVSNGGEASALGGLIYAPGASSIDLSSGDGRLSIGQVIGPNVSITNSGEVIIGGT